MRVYFSRMVAILGRLLIALAIGAAMFMLHTPSASAYTLEGYIWPYQPSPGVCCASLDVFINPSELSVDITGWNDAVTAWNQSAALIYFNPVTYSPAIHVEDTYSSGADWDGITYFGQDGRYFSWALAYLNYYYTQNYSPSLIRGVAAHELGHVAGLDETTVCNAVMWPDHGFCFSTVPLTDDDNGIDAMY